MEKLKYPCVTFQWLNQQKAEPVIFIHLDKSRYTALSTAPNISDEQIFITGKFHAAALNIPYFSHWLTDTKGRILEVPLRKGKAEDTALAAIRVLRAHKARVHTITMDNGKEFYQHTKIAKALAAKTYFCRPYHSWEKGLNENTNGLIRQYFPKQTDFCNISDREIRRIQDELNHRPRKTLGYETPSVLFLNLFKPLIH